MAKDSPVLVLGEALVDVVHKGGQVSEHVGGSPANVAFGLGRLEHDVTLAAWFAKDERGERIAQSCVDANVKVAPGSQRAPRTSVANALIDATGQATYQFDLSWLLPELPEAGVGHLHTGSIGATLEPGGSQVVRALREHHDSATISYDPNARPTLMGTPEAVRGRVEEIIGLADVVKSSDEDIEWLYPGRPVGDVIRHWLSLGPALAVVTRGGDGAFVAVASDDAIVEVAPRVVEVGDTVGAGDSFMAGLLSGLLDADYLGSAAARDALREARLVDIMPAVDRAISTSSNTVSRAGAYAPTRAEL